MTESSVSTKRLPDSLVLRRRVAAQYFRWLDSRYSRSQNCSMDNPRHAWHFFPIRLRLDRLRADRFMVFQALRAEGVGVAVHYKPIHHMSAYRHLAKPQDLPVTERECKRLITLPLFPSMTGVEVEGVIEAVNKVLRFYAK